MKAFIGLDFSIVPLRIGLFGGTFDPPHVGHLVTAVNVRHALALDLVLLMVANDPWQKTGARHITPAADRLAMVQAAVAGIAMGLVKEGNCCGHRRLGSWHRRDATWWP